MAPESRAIVLLSGGLDSTTAAAYARREGWALYALTIRYGQVHRQEIEAARRVALALGVRQHAELDVDLRAFGGSSLVGEGEIPKNRELVEHALPSPRPRIPRLEVRRFPPPTFPPATRFFSRSRSPGPRSSAPNGS